MKLTLLLSTVLAASLFTSVASAQEKKGERGQGRAQMSPEDRANRMKTELGLTDEQTAKVKAVYEKNADKFKALREDKALSEEDRRAKFREMMQGTMKEVGEILTPEQKTKFEAEAAKRREGKGGAPKGENK